MAPDHAWNRARKHTGLRKEIALKVSDVGFEKPLIFRRSFNALGDDVDAKVNTRLQDGAHKKLRPAYPAPKSSMDMVSPCARNAFKARPNCTASSITSLSVTSSTMRSIGN
jgi:hypothetical protein